MSPLDSNQSGGARMSHERSGFPRAASSHIFSVPMREASRHPRIAWLTLLLAALAAGCSTNPATGQTNFTGLGSTSGEIQASRDEHQRILAAFGGESDNAAVRAYVNGVSQRVASKTERTDLPYKFTVLNSPIVNAFVTPGGYVYITRGLLALADNEAELAGVLGHELGHANALHYAQRATRQTLAQFGLVLVGAALGGGELAKGTQMAALGYLQAYSRDQEYEADQLGVRYMSRAGYDPRAAGSFLMKLQAYTDLEAEIRGANPNDDDLDYLATHPDTVDRFQKAYAAAETTTVENPVLNADDYLDAINGLLYGESIDEGIVRGRLFVHPILKIRFEVPPGFELFDTPERIYAEGPGNSLIVLDGDAKPAAGPMNNYLVFTWAAEIKLLNVTSFKVNGLEGATGYTQMQTNRGPMDMRLVAIRVDATHIYRFRFLTPPSKTASMTPAVSATVQSFRTISAAEAAAIKPLRVQVVTVKQGETSQVLARRMAVENLQLKCFMVLNGLDATKQPKPGQRVKIITQ